jgi:hypothetical protein
MSTEYFIARFYSPKEIKHFVMYDDNMNKVDVILKEKSNIFSCFNITMQQISDVLHLNYPIYISRIEYVESENTNLIVT